MTHLYSHFSKQLSQLGTNSYTVALSGGVDSIVLLHLAKTFLSEHPECELKAVHVNHQLSQFADEWQQFCHQICDDWQIPFQAIRVTVENNARESLEASARKVRYQALENNALKGSTLLLGQHLDDQAETFMLRLKRGSGLLGLGAMRQQSTLLSGIVLFRPLLNITRLEIEQYARFNQINHIDDDSNQNDSFDRNFLRNQILPQLNKRFKGFNRTIARVASLLQSQGDLLDEYLAQDLEHCVNEQRFLIDKVTGFSTSRIDHLLRAWMQTNQIMMPSQAVLNQIREQALTAKEDAQMNIECGKYSIKRFKNRLYLCEQQLLPNDKLNIGLARIPFNNKFFEVVSCQGARHPNEDEEVHVRFNVGERKLALAGRRGTKSISTWLKEANIPPWLRAHHPIIFYNNEPVQIIAVGVNQAFYDESGILWRES